jgi:hypothetical protein
MDNGGLASFGRSRWSRSPHGPSTHELRGSSVSTGSIGKTVLTLRQLHPTVEQRDAKLGFGAVELGLQTMQKLAHHLGVA